MSAALKKAIWSKLPSPVQNSWCAMQRMRARVRESPTVFPYIAASFGFALRENERRLRKLKDSAKGQRVFVIGNGPSLLKTDVDLLCDEVTIASNSIFLLFDTKKFRPSFYTIEDYLVAEDRAEEASDLKGSTKLFPLDVAKYIRGDERTIFLNFRRRYGNFPKFSSNFVRNVYWGGTVTMLNIQLAYYLGASEIYIIGCDHNYKLAKEEDEVEGLVIKSNTEDENHFDPRYFGPGYRWHDPLVHRMEEGYQCAAKFLEKKGIPIYNATAGGKLEVFPRVDYGSLFE